MEQQAPAPGSLVNNAPQANGHAAAGGPGDAAGLARPGAGRGIALRPDMALLAQKVGPAISPLMQGSVLIVLLPVLAHAIVVLYNYDVVTVDLIWCGRFQTTTGMVLLLATCYGIAIASAVFICKLNAWKNEKLALQRQNQDLNARLSGYVQQLDNIKTATSRVLVPTSLDNLINRSFNPQSFADDLYKPGYLTAQPMRT